jgi:hypothetical protein
MERWNPASYDEIAGDGTWFHPVARPDLVPYVAVRRVFEVGPA